jgi:hypothetical protein
MHPCRARFLSLAAATTLLSVGLSACGPALSSAAVAMRPASELPSEMQSAPAQVRNAYQFAAANPQVSMNIPCYCGCVSIGHTSNFRCYVSRVDAGGIFIYDVHALGCATCVNITQDSMRLFRQGHTVQEIHAYIDSTYSSYGPSTGP